MEGVRQLHSGVVQPLPVYGDGQKVSDWIHLNDHWRSLELIRWRVREGEIHNIGGECAWKNLDITFMILRMQWKPRNRVQFVADGPGHDRR